MLRQTKTTAQERILKMFPERQFIHRTGGQVNYFILTTKLQLVLSSVIGLVLLWCLFTFFNVLWGQNPLNSSTKELRVQKAQFDRYLVDAKAHERDARELLIEQQKQFELAAKKFEEKHNAIVAMLEQGGMASAPEELTSTIYAQSDILMSPVTLDTIERQDRIAFSENESLRTGTVLDASLVNLDHDQNLIMIQGEAKMQENIELDRALLQATGIPVDDILKNGSNGMGGPFVSLDKNKTTLAPAVFLPRPQTIKARAKEAQSLESALSSVPLGHPIDAENYLTSPYGRRKDPFTTRLTMHTGLDMASYKLAPIVATADGKISFVGQRFGYGRVVEISHGHGFKTRYAHLEKTFVKRGQNVEKGEKIAGMGSTGRSTSTHLHYEVIFEKRTQNPANFIKAGQYVQ
ncbi:MAG: M23 family metallopeptidase [Robiginitomaculum sp.]